MQCRWKRFEASDWEATVAKKDWPDITMRSRAALDDKIPDTLPGLALLCSAWEWSLTGNVVCGGTRYW